MEKGIIILGAIFLAVGSIHFISMRATKLSEAKKRQYRKFFWYFYGVIFMLSGGIKLIEKGQFYWGFFIIEFLLGFVAVILNLFGKLESTTD